MSDTSYPYPLGHSNTSVQEKPRSIPWIWEGVIAEQAVTLLSAPEKIGKTTLLSLLLDRRRAGGQLLGRDVYPGRTILCSEEHERLWALRQPPLDFGPELIFHRPQSDVPTRRSWRRYINDVCGFSFEDEPMLVVIDSAVTFLPLDDRNKRTLRWALAQLRFFKDDPIGFLILNQSRNVHRPLAAFADMVIEMAIPRGLGETRRRHFTGQGRYPGRLKNATAELNAEGTDYLLHEDSAPPQPPVLATLQALLSASPTPLTRQELLARWPGAAPSPETLWRTLARGCQLHLFVRRGAGTKNEPFRYGLMWQHAQELGADLQPQADMNEGKETEPRPPEGEAPETPA